MKRPEIDKDGFSSVLNAEQRQATKIFREWLNGRVGRAAALARGTPMSAPQISKLRGGRVGFTFEVALMIEAASLHEPSGVLKAEKLLMGQPALLKCLEYVTNRYDQHPDFKVHYNPRKIHAPRRPKFFIPPTEPTPPTATA